ncbi:MAG: protein translocase subunit SecD [Thermotoga sp.]|nr:protein translocase subunit SecD [Thermotogota bacterium]RKX52489.1 MAG: protein translocase subunit SecD [Thermotoga sp.]
MRSEQMRVLIVIAVIALSFIFLFYPEKGRTGSSIFKNIKLGLDIKGGTRLDYRMDLTSALNPDVNTLAEDVRTVIRRRLDTAGYTEAVVGKVGSGLKTRIRVEIPGITDPSAAERLIGKKARLYFGEIVDQTESVEKPTPKYGFKYEGTKWLKVKNKENTWYLIKEDIRIGSRSVKLGGEHITDARPSVDTQRGGYKVDLKFDSTGRKIFADITKKFVNKQLPIMLDQEVIVAPVVQEAILTGSAEITGKFSYADARELATLIKSGNLPVNLIKVEERTMGPTLGKDIINRSLKAGIAGLVLVLIYMILYYKSMGVVADIALLYNAFLLFGALAFFRSILTLPGIAGIILTIGTTVDGNIIIFERIKEEMRAGKTVKASIRSGFSKATVTIVDANLTTILAAFVLYYFGTGPIKGFAITLTIGVIGAMFTSLVVSRTLLEALSPFMRNKYATAEEKGI